MKFSLCVQVYCAFPYSMAHYTVKGNSGSRDLAVAFELYAHTNVCMCVCIYTYIRMLDILQVYTGVMSSRTAFSFLCFRELHYLHQFLTLLDACLSSFLTQTYSHPLTFVSTWIEFDVLYVSFCQSGDLTTTISFLFTFKHILLHSVI